MIIEWIIKIFKKCFEKVALGKSVAITNSFVFCTLNLRNFGHAMKTIQKQSHKKC